MFKLRKQEASAKDTSLVRHNPINTCSKAYYVAVGAADTKMNSTISNKLLPIFWAPTAFIEEAKAFWAVLSWVSCGPQPFKG